MPPFSAWLKEHVEQLQSTDFPLDEKLIQLYKPPSTVAKSYNYMWAYGALLRCIEDENTRAYATYDLGISTSVSERAVDRIEVGVLKGIYCVLFSGWNVIFLKVEWIRHDMIKKDCMGFWTCRTDIQEDRRRMNPFLLPVNAEQVFFMEDVVHPQWKIVLRHEPRARRVVENSVPGFDFGPNVRKLDHIDPLLYMDRGA
ncbi:hypothetical protein M758_UG337800 [Ceratodon purpureus]|nr:hypothetical protein M758_UG337800 [Ceratodon purpureus]